MSSMNINVKSSNFHDFHRGSFPYRYLYSIGKFATS